MVLEHTEYVFKQHLVLVFSCTAASRPKTFLYLNALCWHFCSVVKTCHIVISCHCRKSQNWM